MTPEQRDLIRWAVAKIVANNCRAFRRINRMVLIGLGFALVVTVAGRGFSDAIPTWPIVLLTVALALHALAFAAMNQAHKESERRAWNDLLDLMPPSGLDPKAMKSTLPKSASRNGTPKRLFKPDDDSA